MVYLRGLGDKYTTLKDTIMSSSETLDREYIKSRVKDLMAVKDGPEEKASRAFGSKKVPKCYNCGGYGHKSFKCPKGPKEKNEKKAQKSSDRARGKGRAETSRRHRHRGRLAEENEELDSD